MSKKNIKQLEGLFDKVRSGSMSIERLQVEVEKLMEEENKFILGNTTVEVIEGELSPIINVNSKDATINVNGDTIWTRYDKEEYKYIPPNMREFIKDNEEYLALHENLTVDILINGREVSLYFPKEMSKPIVARYTTISTLEEVLLYIGELSLPNKKMKEAKDKITNMWKELNKKVEELGYKLTFSHSMGELFWGWNDISFNYNEWNEQNFLEVSKAIIEFTEEFERYYDGLVSK